MPVFCCCSSRSKSNGPGSTQPTVPTAPSNIAQPESGPLSSHPIKLPPTKSDSKSSFQLAAPVPAGPIEPLELGQLVVEDSESDEEVDSTLPNNSNSTLQLVKTRIRRHISLGSIRKKSRSTLGSSEEEVARRAELKRLMHKRIQEELRSDEGRDAQSLVSSKCKKRASSPIDILPTGGPRDNLEFSVVEATEDTQDDPLEGHLADTANTARLNDRVSLDERTHPPLSTNDDDTKSGDQAAIKDRRSLPHLPSSPNLAPKRRSSTQRTSSIASWRLSYSAGQLSDFLGFDKDLVEPATEESLPNHIISPPSPIKQQSIPASQTFPHSIHSLSRSFSSPARHTTPTRGTNTTADHSPLGTWLRSQGLSSQSPLYMRFEKSDKEQSTGLTVLDSDALYLRRWSSVQNCALPDGDLAQPQTVHLYDMDIHRQLGTRAINTPAESSRYSGLGHAQSRATLVGSTDPNTPDGECKPPLSVCQPWEEPNDKSVDVPEITGVVPTESSSQYPSTSNSGAASLKQSNRDSHPLKRKSLLGVRLPSFQWAGHSYAASMPARSGRNSCEEDVHTSSNSLPGAVTTIDHGSGDVSETSSYRQREAELKSIEKRFGQSRLRKGPPIPIVSKFREEFGESSHTVNTSKSTFFSRFHLTIPKRVRLPPQSYDGSGPDDIGPSPLSRHVLAASASTTSQSAANELSHSRSCSQPSLTIADDSEKTARLWQQAFRDEVTLRTPGTQTSSCRATPDLSKYMASSVEESKTRSVTGYFDLGEQHRLHQSPRYTGRRSVSEQAPRNITSPSEGPHILPSDSEIIESSSCKGKAPAPSPEVSTLPNVWARFPSHTRAERNSIAPNSEHLNPRDFAVQAMEKHQDLNIYPKGTPRPSRVGERNKTRTVSERFGRAVRSKLNKLMPTKSTENAKSINGWQAGGSQNRGDLEYPELELLPMNEGYKELRAFEHEIQHLKTPDAHHHRRTSSHELGYGNGNKEFEARMSSVLHSDGSSEYSKTGVLPTLDRAPTTPTNLKAHRKDSTNTTERFATPTGGRSEGHDTSSFHSYPAHSRPASLVDSVKSDTAVTRKSRPRTIGGLESLHQDVSADRGKFNTWSGRARTQPVLMQSTLDFGEELEEMLRAERAKAMALQSGKRQSLVSTVGRTIDDHVQEADGLAAKA